MYVTYLLNMAATIFWLIHAKVEFKSQTWILWSLPQILCAMWCAGTIQIHPLSIPAGLCSGGGASSYTSFVLPWASPLLPLVSNRQQIIQLEGERMSVHSFSPSQGHRGLIVFTGQNPKLLSGDPQCSNYPQGILALSGSAVWTALLTSGSSNTDVRRVWLMN